MWKHSLLPISLSLLLIITTTRAQNFQENIIQQARSWIDRCVINSENNLLVPEHDLQILLNIVYFSYLRSYITIKSQNQAIPVLNQVWQGWQNIASRRRNPSKQLPYPHCTICQNICASFDTLRKQHESISTIYDTMLEITTKRQLFNDQLLKKNIEHIKEQSRSVISSALLDVQNQLIELCNYMQQTKSIEIDELSSEQELQSIIETKSKLYDYIKEQLPLFAVQSFARTDNFFICASQKNWQALITAQEISNLIWNSIEKKRGLFYLIYYRLLYEKALMLHLTPTILFDEQGLIEKPVAEHALPDPETLMIE